MTSHRNALLSILLFLFALDVATSRSAVAAAAPPDSAAGKAGKAKMPKEQEYSYIYDVLNHSLFRPITRVTDWPRLAR